MPEFNSKTDKIAVVIKEFTLQRKSEIFLDKYSEPFIISLAVDSQGSNNPAIDFNLHSFPKVRKGDTVNFQGQGHLIYGPSNPGEFLAYSILFMESDKDVRQFGAFMEDLVKSKAVNIGMKALLAAAPAYSTALTLLQELSQFIARKLQQNKDDLLFRTFGTLLRDAVPPYDILRSYTNSNDFIEVSTEIIPLQSSNELGSQTKKLKL